MSTSLVQLAFPWLDPAKQPWLSSVENANASTISIEMMRGIAEVAVESHSNWFLPILAPYVDPGLNLRALGLSARPQNRLDEAEAFTFGDLETWTISDLLSLRSMGAGSIDELLRAILLENLRAADSPQFDLLDGTSDNSGGTDEDAGPTHMDHAEIHLETLGRWSMAIGRPDLALVAHAPNDERLPESVRAAAAWLHGLTAGDVGSTHLEVAPLLEERLAGLTEKELRIVRGRILTDPNETLDAIGTGIGVTRERVRQIQSKVQSRLESWLADDSELGYAAAAVRYQLKPITSLERLLAANVALRTSVQSVEMPAWYVLDKLDDDFESDGTWVASPSLQHVAEDTHARFGEVANDHGAAVVTDLADAFGDWTTLDPGELGSWLRHLGYDFVHDYVFAPRVVSIPDRSAAFLSMIDSPQSLEVIHAVACPDKSETSLRNALQSDKQRFVRTDRSEYGLAEWGVREYTSLRKAIGELVDAAGGEVSLDEVIADLSSTFSVTPGSVSAYAHAWPFETNAGVVRRAEAPKQATKTVAETRNLYHVGAGIRLRLRVNSDHLRGSGWAVPSAVAAFMGVSPGSKESVPGTLQSVEVRWTGLQPALSSIRTALIALDAAVDDFVLITINNESSEMTVARDDSSLAANDRVARLLGVTHADRSSVGELVGIGPSAPWPAIVQALRARGESDLADLIVSPEFTRD